ncbi:hypothetical protein I3842_05G012900 [Carya illinoinensis]|uniref:Uncharacterized protein n=1 Tax=Carya illinoinensis TaxID=32201 RepID=A0A922JMP1_CARIL|nr:hypothetical protein I3842_05G012900 [Carya illinoinensis]
MRCTYFFCSLFERLETYLLYLLIQIFKAAQNDKLLEEIIGNNFGSTSSSSTDPIIKVSEIAEKLISAPAIARSTYLVRGKFRMVDFHQSFRYVSCENCNKATGYDLGENFICYSCKNAAIARAR